MCGPFTSCGIDLSLNISIYTHNFFKVDRLSKRKLRNDGDINIPRIKIHDSWFENIRKNILVFRIELKND